MNAPGDVLPCGCRWVRNDPRLVAVGASGDVLVTCEGHRPTWTPRHAITDDAILAEIDRELDAAVIAQPAATPQVALRRREGDSTAGERSDLAVGVLVHILNHRKGERRAFAVVQLPERGRVRVCLCGSRRWHRPESVDVDYVEVASDDDTNMYTRTARRRLDELHFRLRELGIA